MIKPRVAAAGDKNNDRVKFCYICRDHGYPHEAIEFQKVNGRLLSDGTHDTAGWRMKNYFDGREHVHKQLRYFKG